MAVNNRIRTLSEAQSDKSVEYKCGEETVRLSPKIIRDYLVTGGGNVSDQEIVMFLNLCRYQHLNPFLREAYLIKYGNSPAAIVVGKDAITKRAMRNPAFAGQQAGVVVIDGEGQMQYRTGALVLDGETIAGGWSKVFVKGYQEPIETAVSFREYVGLKNDGTINQQWARKPATMIRKVALVQALREAFPGDLQGLYDPSEMGVDIDGSAIVPVGPDHITDGPAIPPQSQELPGSTPPEQLEEDNVAEFADLPGGF